MRPYIVVCVLFILALTEVGSNNYGMKIIMKPTNFKRYTDPNTVCKSYCVKNYYECYRYNSCHKSWNSKKLQLCKDKYVICIKTCLTEFDSINFKKWERRYRWYI